MSDYGLPLRLALFALIPVLGTSSGSWPLALAVGAVLGLAGLGLEARLRSFFDPPIAFFATLALLTSVPVAGPTGSIDFGRVLPFVLACLVFSWFTIDRSPSALKQAGVAALAIAPAIYEWNHASWVHVGVDNLLLALFGSTGLLYGAPLVWLGVVGLASLRREWPALTRLAGAAIIPGALSLLWMSDRTDVVTRAATWLPFLLPGMAECFRRVRSFATRRSERVLTAVGSLLVVWNLLLMEQYRQRLLPSDDTVSFAQVTSNSSALLSHFAGTPFAWPANWLFAKRLHAPMDLWDGVGGRQLFANAAVLTSTIEFGDDPSVFAPDIPLLLEGFGTRRTCEQGWCRDLDGAGRMLLPLQDVGRGDLVVRVRARGQGALRVSLDAVGTTVAEMSDALSDLTLRVPARLVEPGIRVLSLSVAAGGKATLDRITIERDRSPGSTR